MNALKCRFVVAILLAFFVIPIAHGASKDVEALLNVMPGDLPLAVIVPNAQEFDARLAEAMKLFDPEAESPGLVSELKSKVKVADWVDFSKPLGLAQTDISNDETALIFASVPDFALKVKTCENAKNEDGIWSLPFDENTTVFATQQGSYVVASKNKEALQAGLKSTSKLGASIKSRLSLLEGKQILVEVNFEPVRAQALGGIMQLSMIAPMLAMSAGADGSIDPAAISGLVSVGTDGLQKFVEQVAYIDVAIGIKDGAVNATIQPTFNDGGISTYLSAQKSGTEFFKGARTDSYMFAFAWQLPGQTSQFLDYVFDKMETAAATPSPMMGQPQDETAKAAAAAKLKATKETLAAGRKLYGMVQGMGAVVSTSPNGMIASGNYACSKPSEFFSLLADSMANPNPLSDLFAGGMKYQESGSRKIGGVDVKDFAMTADPSKPQAEKAAAMYGSNARFTMGVVGDRIRYCLGSEEFANTFFETKNGGAMDSGIAGLMKNLPAKKNIVVAVNPSGIMGMLAPMLGGDAAAAPVDGPPIGLSISLSGEARLDLHVPLVAIKPLLGAGDAKDGGPM